MNFCFFLNKKFQNSNKARIFEFSGLAKIKVILFLKLYKYSLSYKYLFEYEICYIVLISTNIKNLSF